MSDQVQSRRSFNQQALGSLLTFSLLEMLGRHDLFAAEIKPIAAKWLADLALDWRSGRITLRLGAENLFGAYPDRLTPANSAFLIQTFARTAPFGFNGRFLYARLGYQF